MYIITDADLCTIQNGKEIKFDEKLECVLLSCDTRKKLEEDEKGVARAAAWSNSCFLNTLNIPSENRNKKKHEKVHFFSIITCNGSACLGSRDNPVVVSIL